jgi:hypothetical protein
MTAASAPQFSTSPGFSRLLTIEDPVAPPESAQARARQLCRELELGNIIFLPRSPILIPADNCELLLGRKQSSSAYHKNIAYRPAEDRVTGLDASEQQEAEQLKRILRDYSRRSVEFLSQFLSPYAGKWKLDYASFRPIEEKGRPARMHARNDLLHFDSFPTRPTNGARILRFFTNINPTENRVWLTAQTFEAFGPGIAKAAGVLKAFRNPLTRSLRSAARALHIPGATRPPYDEFMHRCHNAMKENESFQQNTPKHRWEFPPNSSWMVCTDCVSHAVLSGQYALEQTFLIPQSALLEPHRSPLAILQSLVGQPVAL